jgi:hypothetical protein
MSDPLSPARGVLVGLVLGVVFWLLAGAIALVIVVAMRDKVVEPIEQCLYPHLQGQIVAECP